MMKLQSGFEGLCIHVFSSSFSVQNFCGLFVLSLYESFMEGSFSKVKLSRRKQIQPNAKELGGQHACRRDFTF